MKLSDYVTDFLVKQEVKEVFGITGGAIIHLFDSLGKSKDISYVCTHHEQGAAMAADAYSRITGNLGVAIATSGPGATNLLTGTGCSYFDSIPVLTITGQVPTSQLRKNSKARQIGFQETDIVKVFEPVTKYSKTVLNPEDIRYELEKATYLAKSGRPGPVLIDLPDDVQRAEIDPVKLKSYEIPKNKVNLLDLENKVEETIHLIEESKRPLIILGAGVKLSKSENSAKKLIERLQLPVVLTWAAMDMFPDNYPLSVRDFGVTANRPGNFAVQNSDLIFAIGTRLDTHETGSNLEEFAREAKRIVVDIDGSELEKYEQRNFPIDVLINYDVKDFFGVLDKRINDINVGDISKWKNKIKDWKSKYPICPKELFNSNKQIDPYVFLDVLSDKLREGEIIIPEAGCNVTWSFQGLKVKENQKLFTAYNNSPMGYGLPASIGACFANNKKPVVGILGDGGIMMNEQELATVSKHNLPIKLFLLNNEGYGMIKQTQETWLDSRYEASTKKSFHLPDFGKIAKAHGIEKTLTIKNHSELKQKIQETLDYDGPVLCDVKIHPGSRIYPKLEFGKPIEDSSPYLDRKEFLQNMIVKPLEEK